MLAPERVLIEEVDRLRAQELADHLGLSPVLGQLLLQRGLHDVTQAEAFLSDGVEAFHDPLQMRDMARAVSLLWSAIQDGLTIFIHGDYDVDGISSTVLLVEALTELGAKVEHHVPDRFTEGYGVSIAAVQAAAERGCRVLLTVDCGSSSVEAVELAHRLGMQVIIADHHHIPAVAPQPEAFLNPHLEDCSYPFKPLCGTGVAYKLCEALFASQGRPAPHHLLDLVAMATIADVVPLTGENRALVRVGLERLAEFRRPGLKALAEIAGTESGRLGAWAVAFGLGPRLNAAGRLEHARLGVELLLCQDLDPARKLADRLENLNQKRRDIERRMRDDIVERLTEKPELVDLGVVVEAGDSWHQGVIGITAARIVDLYAVPAFVISIEGDLAKGSARAPENVDLYQAMCRCSDVFVKFGGHPRAGGFTIETARIDELRERIAPIVQELRTGPAPVRVDMTLPLEEATLELSHELDRLEPIGEANPRPLFLAKGVLFEGLRAVGKHRDHLQLYLGQGATRRKAIAFRQACDLEQLSPHRLYYDVLYHLQEETWEGQRRVSLVVEAILAPEQKLVRLLGGHGLDGQRVSFDGPELWDLRNLRDRSKALRCLVEQSESSLVLVSGPSQAEKLRRQLGCQVALLDEVPQSAQDMILLAPPSSLEWFRHAAVRQAGRLHLLFGQRELAQEYARQSSLWLDRQQMEQIWRGLMRSARAGVLSESELARVAKTVPAAPETVQAAVGVLEELGVATWELAERERLLRLGKGSGQSLEDSTRFRELRARRIQFLSLRYAFGQRHLRLSEELRGVS
ncbi:MAG: single-stranded-DNA-specific exonuclease RecJ [Candidatus Eremiobacteraeota bacterium]|nr:single-stranded-DNA-specific exonuclease RecJ [Candidatus Eremiobacteraeota bacterium]